MSYHDLSLRETHRYVGTYQHLDQWRDLGSMTIIGNETIARPEIDEENIEEHEQHRLWLKVETHQPEPAERIEQAIMDSHTSRGCAHEHDCCGCRSYVADDPKHEGGPIWSVVVHSYRNF